MGELARVQSLAAGKLRWSDDKITSEPKEEANLVYCKPHFQELLNCHRTVQPEVHSWVQQQRWDTSREMPSDEVPTLQEVAIAVGALENYKADYNKDGHRGQ